MKKLVILLTLAVLVSMTGCSSLNSTNQPTISSTTITTTTSTTVSGTTTTTTIEPIWTETHSSPDTDIPTSTLPAGFFLDKPIPFGQPAINQDGIQITILGYVTGEQAWDIIKNANAANIAPAADAQYILITIKIKNISSHEEPYKFWGTYFDLVVGSTKVYRSRDMSVNVIHPTAGQYQKLEATLNHGDEFTGSVCFYILQGETSLTLVWSNFYGNYQLYFAVK